ncbi:hypothetical protein DFH09DRAFT_1413379 [Mycena vulgaris]|nr:hypothetical protein DFH09DRAFT_1413379 [Mycena vulgaris]
MTIETPRPKAVAGQYTVHQLSGNNLRIATPQSMRKLAFMPSLSLNSLSFSLGDCHCQRESLPRHGGGTQGILGVVASVVLIGGSSITYIVPFAISIARSKGTTSAPGVDGVVQESSERAEIIVVNSMNDRKTDMAKDGDGFFGLPGGFGTFDEVCTVGVPHQTGNPHNVLSFDPLRQLIRNGIAEGFIPPTTRVS